jgi:hypothetical protein
VGVCVSGSWDGSSGSLRTAHSALQGLSALAPILGTWWWEGGGLEERGRLCVCLSLSHCFSLLLSDVVIINKPFLTYCCRCKHFTSFAQFLRAQSY